MRIAIDFDGTITSEHGFENDPKEGAVEAINKLYDAGCLISIYSCRANPNVCDPSDVKRMDEYMKKWGIKYHDILPNKPLFDLLIDDRSANPNTIYKGWEGIVEILKLNGLDVS